MLLDALNEALQLLLACLLQTDLEDVVPVVVDHEFTELLGVLAQLHQQALLVSFTRISETLLDHITE